MKRLKCLPLDISGNSVELVCNVHAHPTPIVKWFKNKMELTEDVAQVIIEKLTAQNFPQILYLLDLNH